ncbi:hypothetical protein AM501_23915 [Aneurinibacillus migulanus]|uniref:type II secretion system F family protein n=1 Tax=Aneurinibacillus migulanus TaxID=47500 RepID=UPI0005BD91A1|nr:type II secretion system F family protein [Aneurinibacillus migulanus]KIV58944.1 hypothetical protein TS64_04065 [Aneurinibacillus migulanus]KPD05824.1 hypothetical protein AM501_23915 [Aneurinibacillus migulanus]
MSTIIFFATFFIYLGIFWIFLNRKEERIVVITGESTEGHTLSLETLSSYFKSIFGFLFNQNLRYHTTRKKLDYSRWNKRTVEEYITIKILAVLIPVVIGFFLYIIDERVGILVGSVFALLGFFLPGLVLSHDIQKRTESQQKEVLTFTELLSAAAGGGMNPYEAIQSAAESSEGVLRELIHEAVLKVESNEGRISDALREMKERTKVEEVRLLIDDLIVSLENGTPFKNDVSNILERMYAMKDEHNSRRAQQLAARLTLPIIVVVLPGLFLLLFGIPAIGYMNK